MSAQVIALQVKPVFKPFRAALDARDMLEDLIALARKLRENFYEIPEGEAAGNALDAVKAGQEFISAATAALEGVQ